MTGNNKVVCAVCSALVDFTAFDMKRTNGEVVEGVVAVDARGEYMCLDCMTHARTHPEAEQYHIIAVQQFISMQQIKQMTGMLVMASDLMQQAVNTAAHDKYGPDADFYEAVRDWMSTYKAFRRRATGDPDNVH